MKPKLTAHSLILFVLLTMASFAAMASDTKPVVWVDHEVNLTGRLISNVLPVADESGKQVPQIRLDEIQNSLIQELMAKGVLLKPQQKPEGDTLIAKVSLTSFKTGSAAGRWVGFGAGSAKCTVRVQLLDEHSLTVVAEVIDTRILDSGGFYTLGADDTFHKELAKELADTLAGILVPGVAKK